MPARVQIDGVAARVVRVIRHQQLVPWTHRQGREHRAGRGRGVLNKHQVLAIGPHQGGGRHPTRIDQGLRVPHYELHGRPFEAPPEASAVSWTGRGQDPNAPWLR
jgi:hypothetical protein